MLSSQESTLELDASLQETQSSSSSSTQVSMLTEETTQVPTHASLESASPSTPSHASISRADKLKKLQMLAMKHRMESAVLSEEEKLDDDPDDDLGSMDDSESVQDTKAASADALSDEHVEGGTNASAPEPQTNAGQSVLKKKSRKTSEKAKLEMAKESQRLIMQTEAKLEVKVLKKRHLSDLLAEFMQTDTTEISVKQEVQEIKNEQPSDAQAKDVRLKTMTIVQQRLAASLTASKSKYSLASGDLSSSDSDGLQIVTKETVPVKPRTKREHALAILRPDRKREAQPSKPPKLDRKQLFLEAKKLDALKYRKTQEPIPQVEVQSKPEADSEQKKTSEVMTELKVNTDTAASPENEANKEGSDSEFVMSGSDNDDGASHEAGSGSDEAESDAEMEDSDEEASGEDDSSDDDDDIVVEKKSRRKSAVAVLDDDEEAEEAESGANQVNVQSDLWEQGFQPTAAVATNNSEPQRPKVSLMDAMIQKMKQAKMAAKAASSANSKPSSPEVLKEAVSPAEVSVSSVDALKESTSPVLSLEIHTRLSANASHHQQIALPHSIMEDNPPDGREDMIVDYSQDIDPSAVGSALRFDFSVLEESDGDESLSKMDTASRPDTPATTVSITDSQQEDILSHERRLDMLALENTQAVYDSSLSLDIPIIPKSKKLKRMAEIRDEESESEDDTAENSASAVGTEATAALRMLSNSTLASIAQVHSTDQAPKMKTNFVEEEAEVEEDEYMNEGGADGEGNDEFDRLIRAELAEFIDEDLDKVMKMSKDELEAKILEDEALRQFFNQQMQEEDMKMTKALAKDIATGKILDRRKHRSTNGGDKTEQERAKFGRTEEEEDDDPSLQEIDDALDYGVFGDIIAKYIENRRKEQAAVRKRKRHAAEQNVQDADAENAEGEDDEGDIDWTNENAVGGLQIAPGLFIETDLDRLAERFKRNQALQRFENEMKSNAMERLKENKENSDILGLIRKPKKVKMDSTKVKDYTTPPTKALVTKLFTEQVAPSPCTSTGKLHRAARIKSINASTAPEKKSTAFQIGGPKASETKSSGSSMAPPVSVAMPTKTPDRKAHKSHPVEEQVNRLRRLLNPGCQ